MIDMVILVGCLFFSPHPLTPSPTAWERGNYCTREHATPLSHAVGEGLGVRAKSKRSARP